MAGRVKDFPASRGYLIKHSMIPSKFMVCLFLLGMGDPDSHAQFFSGLRR